jgi:hypothetical protein
MTTIEELLETVFPVWSEPRNYLENNWRYSSVSHVEAGSNTYTVALRVVGGDEKGNLESEVVKYSRDSHGIRT